MNAVGVKLQRVGKLCTTFLGVRDGFYIEVNNGDQAELFPSYAMAFKAWSEYVQSQIVTGNEDIPYIVEFVPMRYLGPEMLKRAVTSNA